MVSEGHFLKEFLQREFYPIAESRGFRRELLETPYLTVFKRITHDVTHVFEIQWHSNASHVFIINFGEKKPGDNHPPLGGRLHRRKGVGMDRYFGQHKSLVKKITSLKWRYTPGEVLEELLEAFDELEAWWESRAVGPHLCVECAHVYAME